MLISSQEFCAVRGDGTESGFTRDAFTREYSIIGSTLGCWRVRIFGVSLTGDANLESEEFIERIDLSYHSQFPRKQCIEE